MAMTKRALMVGFSLLMLAGAGVADIEAVSVSFSVWDSYPDLKGNNIWNSQQSWRTPHGWTFNDGYNMMESIKAYMHRMLNESRTRNQYYHIFPTSGAVWQEEPNVDMMESVKAYMHTMLNESRTRDRYYRIFE